MSEEKSLTLDDLNYFWTKSGVPCFMADHENIEEIVESFGFNIYYLLCNVAEDKKIETKSNVAPYTTTVSYQTELSTKIVKVINNFVGRSVSVVEDEDLLDFSSVRETALYNLPPIPRTIIDKLDEFFRLVDTQHGTESIVILTFDPNKNDSSGWGVLVPEQTNTSVHCKYEADSIVNQKPDHVMIVGSVHSHPNMAAYASGTDHADQADFDGIHITFGWQKSVNNGATQYHIEMQMGGSSWTLKPEDVFEGVVFTKDPDPEVVEWTQNVKKVSPPQGGSHTPVARLPQDQQDRHPESTRPGAPTTLATYSVKGDPRYQDCPDPKDPLRYIIVAEMNFKNIHNSDCPACGYYLSYSDMTDGACPCCDIAICDSQDSYNAIIYDATKYMQNRKMSLDTNIYLWSKDKDGHDLLMKIYDYTSSGASTTSAPIQVSYDEEKSDHKSLISSSDEEYEDYFFEGFSYERTACCDIPVEEIEKCTCIATVLYEDVLDFDRDHPFDIYDQTGNCASCEHYYSRNCPAYFSSIMDYAQRNIKRETKIEECSNYIPYERTYTYSSYLD